MTKEKAFLASLLYENYKFSIYSISFPFLHVLREQTP